MTLAAQNSNVKVNITTWFDDKGLTQAERQVRRAYQMQAQAAKEMDAEMSRRAKAQQLAAAEAARAEAQAAAARKEALNGVANTMLGVGVAMTAMAGLAVAKFAEFDQAMSQVSASSEDAKANIGALKDAALEAGARTAYSATEAAGAIEELSKAGMGVADILNGGLNGALDLAAAGSLDVAQAAELTATTLIQFGLAGDQATHVADLLSAGANKAQGSVSDMGLALSYVGTSAAQLGVSVEETSGTLALLASNGILAEKAGTGLRGVIMALTAPSKAASAAMEEYGINVFDTSGNFIGMAGVAEQLHANLGDLDEATRSAALGQIFGNEQINVARVLYKDGASAVDEWTAAVDDQGNAARTAGERLDNLKGDLETLSGSWETLLIKTGEGANGPLREMVQGITGVVNALGDMPPAAQTALLWIVGGGGLVSLSVGGMLKLTTAISNAKNAMETLGWSAKRVTVASAGIGGVLAVAAYAFMKFSAAQAEAKQRADEYAQSLDAQTGAITENTATLAANNLEKSGALEASRRLGIDSGLLVDAILGEAGAMEELNAVLETYQGSAEMSAAARQQQAEDVNKIIGAVGQENRTLEESIESHERQADAVESSSASTREAQGATESATAAVDDQVQAIEDLIKALDVLNGANQSREQAEINWQKQLVETNETLAEGAKTLDITTEAGRGNRQAMLDMAEAAQDLAEKRLEQSGNEREFRDTLNQARDALFAQARQFFATDEEAQAYVDTLLQVPPDVETEVRTPGLAAATADLLAFYTKAVELDGKVINVRTNYTYSGTLTGSAYIPKAFEHADGGVVEFYGSGGLRENHVAQIAPAGAWRVWAEPETGGEAYIPLAPSKRARSLEVWQETGARLGVGAGSSGPLDLTPETIAGIGVAAARAVQRGVDDLKRSQSLAGV